MKQQLITISVASQEEASIFHFTEKLQLRCHLRIRFVVRPAAIPFLRVRVNYKKNSKYTFLQTITIVFPANSSSILLYFTSFPLHLSSRHPPPNVLDFLQAFPFYFSFPFPIQPAVYISPMAYNLTHIHSLYFPAKHFSTTKSHNIPRTHNGSGWSAMASFLFFLAGLGRIGT